MHEELKSAPATCPENLPQSPGLSFGQKAAGVSFNPSGDPDVNEIKEKSASLIDRLAYMRSQCIGEKARYFSKAITDLESAQMFAVKAITWKH